MSSFDRNNTQEKVFSIVINKLNIDAQLLEQSSNFQDLGADSLDMVEIIMKLEEEFAIEIDDADAERLATLDEVIDYVHKKRKI